MLNHTTANHSEPEVTFNGNGQDEKKSPKSEDPAALLATLKAQIEELQRQFVSARGTRNDVKPEPKKLDLLARIEQALRSHICTTKELAKLVDESEDKVSEKLKSIRKHVADVGTPEEARWVWRIGDATSSKELRDMVAMLIEGHAMTTAELARITGARMPRVNGVLVELQRDSSVPIYDLGSSFRAKWLILPKGARPANLPPKGRK